MAAYSVNTALLRRLAPLAESKGSGFKGLAGTIKGFAADSAALGDEAAAAAFQGFVKQWGEEVVTHGEAWVTLAAGFLAAASLYDLTERANDALDA